MSPAAVLPPSTTSSCFGALPVRFFSLVPCLNRPVGAATASVGTKLLGTRCYDANPSAARSAHGQQQHPGAATDPSISQSSRPAGLTRTSTMEGATQLLNCQFSPTGNYMAAGGSDCCTYIWTWDVNPEGHVAVPGWKLPGRGKGMVHVGNVPSEADVARMSRWWGDREWPRVEEVVRLDGMHDVILVGFSHGGERLATAAKDGVLRVYGQRVAPQAKQVRCKFASIGLLPVHCLCMTSIAPTLLRFEQT